MSLENSRSRTAAGWNSRRKTGKTADAGCKRGCEGWEIEEDKKDRKRQRKIEKTAKDRKSSKRQQKIEKIAKIAKDRKKRAGCFWEGKHAASFYIEAGK